MDNINNNFSEFLQVMIFFSLQNTKRKIYLLKIQRLQNLLECSTEYIDRKGHPLQSGVRIAEECSSDSNYYIRAKLI